MSPPGGARSSATIRVVIIDDHVLVAEGMAAVLSSHTDIVVLGREMSCTAGLACVLREQPDVVLLDERLPDGRGTDLLPAMMSACPTTKIIVVTGQASDDVLHRAIQGGCAGFLRKGARAAEMVAAVRAASRAETVIHVDDLRRLLPSGVASNEGQSLTRRERAVLGMLVAGQSTAGIAEDSGIALATARNHVQAVLSKLGAHSRVEAVAIALRTGIVAAPC